MDIPEILASLGTRYRMKTIKRKSTMEKKIIKNISN